ncbi:MAG: AAA family ATPase [Syntrophales bacterium]|nr:AAA family ATPase [Syntrophales bacterium]
MTVRGQFPAPLRCYFFFDEIQRIDQWEMFIRRLLDTENIQIFITGSSSKLLGSEIATSLRGRSLAIEIFPFSFEEFLKFHGLFSGSPKTFGANTASVLRKAAKDYLEVGGFPEVQNLDRNLRIEVLQGYIDSVLLKDIIERHKVSNILVLKHLVHLNRDRNLLKFSLTSGRNVCTLFVQ